MTEFPEKEFHDWLVDKEPKAEGFEEALFMSARWGWRKHEEKTQVLTRKLASDRKQIANGAESAMALLKAGKQKDAIIVLRSIAFLERKDADELLRVAGKDEEEAKKHG